MVDFRASKVIAIVQARSGSSRLPNKILKKIGDYYVLELLLRRLSISKNIDQIVLATTNLNSDDLVCRWCGNIFPSINIFRGDEDDVLARYYKAASMHSADVIVRITGDCPFVDPSLVDDCINLLTQSRCDYASNIDPATFPDGLDVEVFTFERLKAAFDAASKPADREHVTPWIRRDRQTKKSNLCHQTDLSGHRWTIDVPEDLSMADSVCREFNGRFDFSWSEILDLQIAKPELFEVNSGYARNSGGRVSRGQKLWSRAKEVIPGGNMLLSKRSEMFLPQIWPAYYKSASGCEIVDLDGNVLLDVCTMGVGTNLLGYCNAAVDDAVVEAIRSSNMSTLNAPEEVFLAERLIELHPWADMVKFARTGGEANAIAIRIARAASGKEKVAFCGYHGWHDWYLATNLGSPEALDSHLLSGLEPNGVPASLRGSVIPFEYNNIGQLKSILQTGEVGVIVMEVERSVPPADGFLEKVRSLANKYTAVLVFDECTSGFRETFGGLHLKHGVNPDLAVFGKALGNGYAITAIIGRRSVMESAQSTFISSTFWTERSGLVAAQASLIEMERIASWQCVTEKGQKIKEFWADIASANGLALDISGIDPLPVFKINSDRWLLYKTFITQELLKKGLLGANSIYLSVAHSDEVINFYKSSFSEILEEIGKDFRGCVDLSARLQGPICHEGFRRIN